MVEYDLHVHTNASDGILSPEQIFKIAQSKGLKGIAITDHDTVNGLEGLSISADNYGLEFVPGIELSTDWDNSEVHILGYFIEPDNRELLDFLDILQQTRLDRAQKMIQRLQKLGYDISLEEIVETSGADIYSFGRPHIARALIRKGYYSSIKEVFEDLIGRGKPAYVSRYKVGIKDAISKIVSSNGVPVLAHPMLIKGMCMDNKFEAFLEMLVGYGIQGIEVFHSKHTAEDEVYLAEMASKYSLVITGGSDCHGHCGDGGEYLLGSKGINVQDFIKLKNLVR